VNWDDLIGGESVYEAALIAAEDIQKQSLRASNFVDIVFDQERYRLILGDPEARSPITIHSFNKSDFTWVLAEDPYQWRFVPSSVINASYEDPGAWGMLEFLREMAHWPPVPCVDFEEVVRGHYSALSLWLRFPLLHNSPRKDELRQILYHTDLIYLKPYADLSEARRQFAYQIYPRLELAQRAESKDHLWFCMEYSSCLQKFHWLGNPLAPLKDEVRTNTTNCIRNIRAALKTGNFIFDEILTIEALQREGADWHRYIADLLLHEAIRKVWTDDADSKDLKRQCNLYLDALSHYNGQVGHKEQDVILILTPDGDRSKTKKNYKRKKSTQRLSSGRGRGRPPKGFNVKNH